MRTELINLALVGSGGALGAMARYGLGGLVHRNAALAAFPFGTLAVNLSGAVLLGFVSALALGHTAALLAGTAFVGAYTTFSTWMFETQRLAEERQFAPAVANVVVSVVFGVAAAGLGIWLAGLT